MVSPHFQSTSIHTTIHPLFFNPPHHHHHRPQSQFKPRPYRTNFPINSADKNIYSRPNIINQPKTLFLKGYKRLEIKVPTLVLQVNPEQVLLEDKSAMDFIDDAVSKSVGIMLLSGGEGSGGKLYEAACLLKSVIKDRAYVEREVGRTDLTPRPK